MDEREMAEVLDGMAARRVESLRREMRWSIARSLLDQHGEVSAADVGRRFEVEWREPDAQALADQMAAKCAAAVDVARRAVEVEQARRARVAARVEQLESRAEAVLAKAVDDRLPTAEAALAQAHALAEFAVSRGDPARAPEPYVKAVAARSAEGSA